MFVTIICLFISPYLKDFNLQRHQPLMGAHEGMQNKIGGR